MRVDLFDYDLPPDRIAQEPRPRGRSRLLVLDRATGHCEATTVASLPSLLREGDLLVANDTRVIPARIFGTRSGDGRRFEFLLTRVPTLPAAECRAEAMIRPGKKARPGDRFDFGAGLVATLAAKRDDGLVELDFAGRPLLDAIEEVGVVPLPPYIERPEGESRPSDREAYQTVWARVPGAVAAPTAGLHFDDALLAEIDRRGVRRAFVTLTVGPGTFRPVKAEELEGHAMDAERYEISAGTARLFAETRARGGRVCVVGTTTVRALESAVSDDGTTLAVGPGETRLFIRPGYRFRAVDALMTNFHLPKSTLLVLVSTFAGREAVLAAYERAKRDGFLFYSYGDAMWIA